MPHLTIRPQQYAAYLQDIEIRAVATPFQILVAEAPMLPAEDHPLAFGRLLEPDWLLEQILNAIEALVVVTDREGRIVFFNRAAEHTSGYAQDEVIGQPLIDTLVAPSERATVRAVQDRLLDAPTALHIETHWIGKTDQRRLIRWSAATLADENGPPQGLVKTGIDVTRRRALESELVGTDEELRRRFGQDLHDMLASHLSGVAMMAAATARKVERGKVAGAEELITLTDLIRDAMEQVRAFSHSLVAPELEAGSLPEALERLTERTETAAGVDCSFSADHAVQAASLSQKTATHLYRIAQEALHNALTHAAPSQVKVRLTLTPDETSPLGEAVVLTVHDDGRGLPEEAEEGVGLRNMQRRARLVGAALHIEANDTGGTRIRCVLPLPAPPSDPATT